MRISRVSLTLMEMAIILSAVFVKRPWFRRPEHSLLQSLYHKNSRAGMFKSSHPSKHGIRGLTSTVLIPYFSHYILTKDPHRYLRLWVNHTIHPRAPVFLSQTL